MGVAIINVRNINIKVVIIAGNKDTFSIVYSGKNNDGLKLGIPLINMYAIMKKSTLNVINAADFTAYFKSLLNY